MKKIGIITEAPKDSGDQRVFAWLVEQYCKDMNVVFVGNRNKNELLNDSPAQCESLLAIDNCDKVLIIYDLQPRWGKKQKQENESFEEKLNAKLQARNIDLERVSVVCIKQMLETWLVADENAVRSYKIKKHKLTEHEPPFNGGKKQVRNAKPKDLIEKYLSEYNPTTTALEIIKEANLDKVARRSPSLQDFKTFVEENCEGD